MGGDNFNDMAKKLLQALKATSSKGGQPQPQQQRRRGPPPVALPLREVTRSTNQYRVSGSDRLMHIPDVSKYADGDTVLTVPWEPSLHERLGILAKAFQRYTIHSLRFEVRPMLSSATSGGYVVGFIPDPEDVNLGSRAAARLTATVGSVTAKWWELATVVHRGRGELLYTATVAGQERQSSPGVFAMVVDGKSTQVGSLTIAVHYDVQLSAPGVEAQKDAGVTIVKADLKIAAGFDYIIVSSTNSNKAADMFTGPIVGAVYRLPTPRSYLVNESGAVVSLATYYYLRVDSATKVRFCSADGTEYGQKSYHDATVVFTAEELVIAKKPENYLKGLEYLELGTLPLTQSARSQPLRTSEQRLPRARIAATFGGSSIRSMSDSSPEPLSFRDLKSPSPGLP